MKTCTKCGKRIQEHWKVCNDCDSQFGALIHNVQEKVPVYGNYYHLLNKYEEQFIKNFRLEEMWTEMNDQVQLVLRKNQELEKHNKMLEHIIALYPLKKDDRVV